MVVPRRRKNGVGDQETESRPRRRAFDKDPVENVALVGKVPDVSGRFRSEVELRGRIGRMIDGVPSDPEAATSGGEGQISRTVIEPGAATRRNRLTYATTMPTKMPTCTAG